MSPDVQDVYNGTDVDIALYSMLLASQDVYYGTNVDIILYLMLLDLQDVYYGTDVEFVLYLVSLDVQVVYSLLLGMQNVNGGRNRHIVLCLM